MIHKTGLEFDTSERQSLATNVVAGNLTLKEMEKRYIIQALESEGGRVSQAAKRLGIPRSSLYAKIREYAILSVSEGRNVGTGPWNAILSRGLPSKIVVALPV
jgi:DNA-binding NtrC family response regulator